MPGYGAAPNLSGVDVNRVLLEQSRMQAITGGGEHLTIIPSMDSGDSPVGVDTLAPSAPPECRFVFADSATFGPDIEEFHKTTYQDPPHGGPDLGRAAPLRLPRRRYRASRIQRPGGNRWPLCGQLWRFEVRPGIWKSDEQSLQTRPGDCGRDYLLKSVVLIEVTFCGFPDSVSTIVITNIAANVPG